LAAPLLEVMAFVASSNSKVDSTSQLQLLTSLKPTIVAAEMLEDDLAARELLAPGLSVTGLPLVVVILILTTRFLAIAFLLFG